MGDILTPRETASHSRRLFLASASERFKILSFSQRTDGSIYISAPGLAESKWLELIPGVPPTLLVSEIPNAGKLSIHGSGVSHVRAINDGEAELRLVGNHLLDLEQQRAGVRHLITILPNKPPKESEQTSGRRLADCTIEAKELKPYVLIFWAVPGVVKRTVKVQASFDVDDLESVPPESGFGAFLLRQHSIVWFAYRTKHMQRWPAHNLLCFHDGFVAPTLIGIGEGACRLELRSPRYELNVDELVIAI